MIAVKPGSCFLRIGESVSRIRLRLLKLMTNVRFRYFLPMMRRGKLAGVRLNLEGLSPMMKNIILTGRYESEERRLCDRALVAGDIVLQLGSAIGFIGLYCLKTIGVSQVYEVEANPETLRTLKANYRLNGEVARVLHTAVASEDGELELSVGGEFWENSLVAKGDSTIRVPAKELQSILKLFGYPEITALVCDIEGAEALVDFEGLPESVRTIIIEFHPGVVGSETVGRIERDFRELGFQMIEEAGDVSLYLRGA